MYLSHNNMLTMLSQQSKTTINEINNLPVCNLLNPTWLTVNYGNSKLYIIRFGQTTWSIYTKRKKFLNSFTNNHLPA